MACKQSTRFEPAHLITCLQALPLRGRLWVALSGGLDSTVLLHALVHNRTALAPITLAAVHVHHGLQTQADQWAEHCADRCAELGVDYRLCPVEARAKPGESPEAAARQARYSALAEVIGPGDVLVTGQHQDDLAETLLLQLLRGSGPAGLAGMAPLAPLGRGWLARPLLGCSRAALAAWAQQQGLTWLDDPSNADRRLDRNFLRHEVLPVLQRRWPSVRTQLARASQHQAEAAGLLRRYGRASLDRVAGAVPGTLSMAALQRLSGAQQRNTIRTWLSEKGLALPSAMRLQTVLQEVLGAARDRQPRVTWEGGEIRRFQGDLYAMAPLSAHDPKRRLTWDLRAPLWVEPPGIWLQPAALRAHLKQLPARPQPQSVTVGYRQGGERCRPAGQARHRALKALLQEAGIPPWQRDRIPLVFVGARLVWVVGYGFCD